ncbi:MAG: hypothetical protein NTZ98_02750 [Acidobacteria bacterium]|jgi:hypothetical protein|nr:hypothetical protein [Acidobacteriota bacterium]
MALELVTSSVSTSAFDPVHRGRLSHLSGVIPELVLEQLADVIFVSTDQKEFRSDWQVRTQRLVVESGESHRSMDPITVQTSALNEFIAFELSLVPEVQSVYAAFRDNRVFYVWVIIDRWERKVRERVYARQQAVIDSFPDFAFDFYVVPKGDEDPTELLSGSMELAYERRP